MKIVKERSEPVSQKLLSKTEDYINREKPGFKEAINYLKQFSLKNGVKVP